MALMPLDVGLEYGLPSLIFTALAIIWYYTTSRIEHSYLQTLCHLHLVCHLFSLLSLSLYHLSDDSKACATVSYPRLIVTTTEQILRFSKIDVMSR
jgi:hypothetical protein